MLKEEDLEPDIGPFGYYISSFNELGTSRSSMVVGPIPFGAIYDYWKIMGVGDFEEFLFFIRLMDNKFLELESNKIEAKTDGKK